ncbi:MAG: ABC transporter substrate-binding protein [Desulfovibrio sp.]|nr:ABC transporter substrate-binding protein [Desulfovibrio sp.]
MGASTAQRAYARTIIQVLILLLAMTLCGCPKPSIFRDEQQKPVQADPLREAENAYVAGNYKQAESAALRLSTDPAADKGQKNRALRLLAAAALKNNHPSLALTALDDWSAGASGVDAGQEWQDALGKALRALNSNEARTRADAIYQNGGRSLPARSAAGVMLAVRQWRDGDLGQSLTALENIYSAAATEKEKAALERRLALELHLAGAQASAPALGAISRENRTKFPYNIILLDKLRRDSQDSGAREAALVSLRELESQVKLADPSLFSAPPTESEILIQGGAAAYAPAAPISGQPVVLLLPLSGQYATVSEKIAAGARVACDEMSAQGQQVPLIVIDSGQADWVGKVESLPRNATIIGGPLRRDDYNQVKSRGLTAHRAFFAFLPSLESGDEGARAWRFFSSPQDQVDTLLAFTSRLGIKGYGIFYPDENFGRRMAALFEERARAAGAAEVITTSYTPQDQNNWMSAASSFLGANKKGSVFRAIFLPDSWKNMDGIVPNFFYQNETRQVLLGTSLWEQGLSGGGFVSTQYYGLAVFPGAWNASSLTPSGSRLQQALTDKKGADFWSGLGYDFARLSVKLGVGEGFAPTAVNAALQSANLDWSIAPIRWTSGMAAQAMHLFTPDAKGFVPVDEQSFRTAYDEAWR